MKEINKKKEKNLWLMRGPLSNQGWFLANFYSNEIVNSKSYSSLFKRWNRNTMFFCKNDCLTSKNDQLLTLHKKVFIYNVYRDERFDPLVVDCSLNLVNY